VVIACSTSACTSTLPRYPVGVGARSTGFYTDPARPELALLEYRIARYLAAKRRPYATICAVAMQFDRSTTRGDAVPLDAALEGRLLARFPELSPSTVCERHGLAYVDRRTQAPAAAFDVHELLCSGPSSCTAWGGYYALGEHGWGYYELRWRRDGWSIGPKDLGIVLTAPGT